MGSILLPVNAQNYIIIVLACIQIKLCFIVFNNYIIMIISIHKKWNRVLKEQKDFNIFWKKTASSELLPLKLWHEENCSVNVPTNVRSVNEHDSW